MRLELTRKTDLALRVLRVLGGGARRKGGELATAVGTTPTYIGQVVAPLVQAGWVVSDPGPTGGYRLAPGTRQVSLLQLVEAVEGPTINGRCVLNGGACGSEGEPHPVANPCALHEAWVRARDALLRELSDTPVVPAPSWQGGPP